MTPNEKILEYWFEDVTDETLIDKRALPFRKWFAKDPVLDQEILEKFETDLTKARQGQYKDWEHSIRGRLALIILFDQFSRNMYRNTHKMFENDFLALELSLRSINEKIDGKLPLIERMFLYMPLMHSEDLDVQKLSLKYFEQLLEGAKQKFPQNAPYYQSNLRTTQQHFSIIKKFGRFVQRDSSWNR